MGRFWDRQAPYPDTVATEKAAGAHLGKLNRGLGEISLTLKHEHPSLFAEARLSLSDLRMGVDGEWVSIRMSHALSNGGYETRMKAEISV